jgi:hypothetical protein
MLPGRVPRPLRLEANDQPLELRRGLKPLWVWRRDEMKPLNMQFPPSISYFLSRSSRYSHRPLLKQ